MKRIMAEVVAVSMVGRTDPAHRVVIQRESSSITSSTTLSLAEAQNSGATRAAQDNYSP